MVVTTSPLVKTYSLQEFWDLPEPTDHSKLELIKGVLYMTPPPDNPHNKTCSMLVVRLQREIDRCKYRGTIYVPRASIWLDDDTYLEPDLMYISHELESQMDPKHWTRADIAIEVISRSTLNYDRSTKSDTYRAMGVREVWLVDTEKQEVEVRSFVAGKTTICKTGENLRSQVLPKIKIPVAALFS